MNICLITSNPLITVSMKTALESVGELTVVDGQKLGEDKIFELANEAEILIAGSSGVDKISRNLLQKLTKLKLIATLSVGVAWVDVVAAKELGVAVCNVKGANAESVAEHAWGMVLDLSKRITEFDRDVRNKGAYKFAEYTGKEVYGKTLGVIGLGDIGQKIARIATGFNMKILGYNRSQKDIIGIEQVDFSTLISNSDVIVVALPLTEETKNLISSKEIEKMKDGVILVNPAMEQITDKDAVLSAVDSGKIYGFGIETDIMKPIPVDDPYLKNPRILITPHNAFNTDEANTKTYDLAVENVKKFIEGQPQNRIC